MDGTTQGPDWIASILDQLEGHWIHQLRPRLDGLTDAEYLWEPVPDCWNLRPSQVAGELVLQQHKPAPNPTPVTTIGWRLAHLIGSVVGKRLEFQFGGAPMDLPTHGYPGTADGALAELDRVYAEWTAAVRTLGVAGMARPLGMTEGADEAHFPMVDLVLHINREIIHHGAEICLLRDLYQRR